jgi:hypothetical protein
MGASLSDGWRLGGAALAFVSAHRPLQRFVLGAVTIVFAISVAGAVIAVMLRRQAGPVGYALVGLAAYYGLSVLVTAVSVGVAGLVAETLEGRPVTPATGWRVMRSRRRTIAGWALVDLVAGIPSRAIGSWTVDQLGVLLIGFGWSLVSFFAIPTIALTSASPLATARHSLRLVRGQWGDAVYSTVSLWVRAVVVFGLPSAGSAVVGVLLIRHGRVVAGGALFAAGVAGLALTYLLAQTARSVLTVVLYRYAEAGRIFEGFPAELIARGLRGPSSVARRIATRIESDRLLRLRRRVLGDDDDRPETPPPPE